jgi:hypothetical protein
VLLHDRRMPGGRGNLDHLAIAPTGIYVIDAKHHTGKVSISSPLIGTSQMRIAGRDQTKLLDGLDRQLAAVRAALGDTDPPSLHGVLCFTQADLPLLTRPARTHLLLHPRQLAKRLNRPGAWTADQITATAITLTTTLPTA